MGNVIIIEHHPHETAGTIADALVLHNLHTKYYRTYQTQPPKEMEEADGLIIMGGPMSVYDTDQHPFLLDEMALIEDAMSRKNPILGVCLGSQLIAKTLGAEVKQGAQKELGWHPVALTNEGMEDTLWKDIPTPFTAFHWHGDIYDLPQGAVKLAYSAVSPCQCFRYDKNIYGMLFHLEMTETMVYDMVHQFKEELHEAHLNGSEIIEEAQRNAPLLEDIGEQVFSRWASLVIA